MAAYTNGRTSVSEYDCLLLRHILWQRPEESERIYDWVINALASDDGLKQPQYLLSGEPGSRVGDHSPAAGLEQPQRLLLQRFQMKQRQQLQSQQCQIQVQPYQEPSE